MKVFEAKNLSVSTREGKKILSGVDFSLENGETAVLLGRNGAGKSTIANAISGNPKFKVSGSMKFLGKEISKMTVDKRARLGILMSFQSPVEIPGISTTEMIRSVLEERKGGFVPLDEVREEITASVRKLGTNIWFSERELNVGFSGGEKKKNEILQMLSLKPKFVILDEIDSGLDIDASKKISKILAEYQKETECTYLIITHNMRVLANLKPSKAILLEKGCVIAVGDGKLVRKVEKEGYEAL